MNASKTSNPLDEIFADNEKEKKLFAEIDRLKKMLSQTEENRLKLLKEAQKTFHKEFFVRNCEFILRSFEERIIKLEEKELGGTK